MKVERARSSWLMSWLVLTLSVSQSHHPTRRRPSNIEHPEELRPRRTRQRQRKSQPAWPANPLPCPLPDCGSADGLSFVVGSRLGA